MLREARKMTRSEKSEMLDMIERMSTTMHKRFPMSETSVPPSQLAAADEVKSLLNLTESEDGAALPKAFFSFFEIERTETAH